MPVVDGELQPPGLESVLAELAYGVVHVDAVATAAISDDLTALGNLVEPGLEPVDRNRSGSGNVAGLELTGRADVGYSTINTPCIPAS